MRLYALMKPVCRAAFFIFIFLLMDGCQKSSLVPVDELDGSSRSDEEVSDSIEVNPDFDVNDWEETDSVTFNITGTPVAMRLTKGGTQ